MKVAIKTYRRSNIIAQKTLAVLQRSGLAEKDIYLFLRADQQADYRAALPRFRGHYVLVPEAGIRSAVNTVQAHFPRGTEVLHMDDDIDAIERLDDGRLLVTNDLHALAKLGFELCAKWRTTLWGVYPVRNPYFMSDRVATGLQFIWAGFYGFISEGRKAEPTQCEMKDDFERSIRTYLEHGTVIRFNGFCAKTSFAQTGGGTHGEERNRLHLQDARQLAARYPSLVRLRRKKNFGGLDVVLRNPQARQQRLEGVAE